MKLNIECIRDILLFLEDNLIISDNLEENFFTAQEISAGINYPLGETANTLLALNEAGFIRCSRQDAENCIHLLIADHITYAGYQFLETIRPETVCQKTISICKSVGSFSLDIVSKVASNILMQMITNQLHF